MDSFCNEGISLQEIIENTIELGKGAFGIVSLIFEEDPNDIDNSILKASKKQNNQMTEKTAKEFETEMKFLGSIAQHQPTVINIYDFVKKSQIILDFAPGGSLCDLLNCSRLHEIEAFDYTQKCIIIFGIAYGINILHLKGIIHRDIKPDNVLLDHLLRPKLADFGSARHNPPEQCQLTYKGTLHYMSPEMYNQDLADAKIDVYSYGMTVYHIITGCFPYELDIENFMRLSQNDMHNKIVNYVSKGTIPKIPPNTPFSDIISDCLKPIADRPSMNQVLNKLDEFITTDINVDKERYHAFKTYIQDEGNNDICGTLKNLKYAVEEKKIPFSNYIYGRIIQTGLLKSIDRHMGENYINFAKENGYSGNSDFNDEYEEEEDSYDY